MPNAPSPTTRGAPKHGSALLAGLLRCRRCGQKLTIQYTGAKHDMPRYACSRGRLGYSEPSCTSFGGLRVDDAVEAALEDLRAVWSAPTTAARLKKRIVRTVVQGAIVDLDEQTNEIIILVHWVEGAHTERRLPRRRRGRRNGTPGDIVEAVRGLALVMKDHHIAGVLNRNGLKTGNGNRWTRERITALRSHYRIPVYKPAEDSPELWLTLNDAAALVGVAARTLRLAAEHGETEAAHPLADGPWLFRRPDLDGPAGRALALRVRNRRPTPR